MRFDPVFLSDGVDVDFLAIIHVLFSFNITVITYNHIINEPRHKIFSNVICLTIKVSDQPAHNFYYVQSDQSLCWSLEYSITLRLLPKHHLEFQGLKGGCKGSSEKMAHCRKSNVAAYII